MLIIIQLQFLQFFCICCGPEFFSQYPEISHKNRNIHSSRNYFFRFKKHEPFVSWINKTAITHPAGRLFVEMTGTKAVINIEGDKSRFSFVKTTKPVTGAHPQAAK